MWPEWTFKREHMTSFIFIMIYSGILIVGLIGTVISASYVENHNREDAVICGVIFSIIWPITIIVGLSLGLVDILILFADLLHDETKS